MNWLRGKLADQAVLKGVWLASGSPAAAELAAEAGFDWALLDMEHGLGGTEDILRQIELLTPTTCAAIVRPPRADSDLIPRLLDHGAAGIMAPMIDSAAEAASLVHRLRYPPQGTRGLTRSSRASRYGQDFAAYFRHANDNVAAMVQIETAEAVGHADAIAAEPGVDVLFIGHSDLSLSLGCFEHLDAPVLRAAEDAVLGACARHGKRAGMLLKASMNADAYRQRGFSVMALGTDLGCLKQGFGTLLREL